MSHAPLGPTLRRLRRAARLSQQKLAEQSKVSRGTIRNTESGKVRPLPGTLEELARGLAMNVDGEVDEARAAYSAQQLLEAGYGLRLQAQDSPAQREPQTSRMPHTFYEFLLKKPGLERRLRLLQTREISEKGLKAIEGVLDQVIEASPPATDQGQ